MLSTLRQKGPSLTASSVLECVQGHLHWRKLGKMLFYWDCVELLNAIQTDNTSDQDRLYMVLEHWLKGRGRPPSWRMLAYSLDKEGELTVADSIRAFAEPLRDATLTHCNIVPVMEKVSCWWKIGVPDPIRERIMQRYSTETERSCEAGKYWIDTCPFASWESLALKLYYSREDSALEKVAHYLPRVDPTLTNENLMEVLKGVESRWNDLADKLVVRSEISEIETFYHNDTDKMEAVVNEYVRHFPTHSWRRIVRALKKMRLHQLASVITTKYIQGPEERRYLAACERAMKEKGSLEQTAMHCVFMGMPRSGKTSLLRRLLRKRLSSHASTGVAERVVRVEIRKSTVHVSGLVWCELEDLGDEAMSLMRDVSRTSADDMTEPFPLSADVPVDTQPHSKRLKLATSSSPNLQSSAEQQVPEEQGTNPALEVFREAFQKKCSELDDLDELEYLYPEHTEHWTLYLTDTGGQPEFQELLPILVCGPSLFFLVFRLDLELNSRYKVEYVNSSGRSIVPYKADLTMQETLLQNLATIASTSIVRMVDGQMVDILPRVFFVGTHRDRVSDEHLLQIDNTLQAVVKRTEAFRQGMVQFASESRLILAVDNKSKDEEDVQQVRAAVERIGRRGDNYRVKTLVSWLMFSIILQHLKAPVLNYEQCYKVARQCRINTHDEMNDALRFLHENVGVIRYYHDVEELREYVIKNLRYLFNMITDLLVATFTFDRTDPSICELFRRKGIFPLDVFEKLAKSTEFLPPAKLVTLLQHLNIVALLRKDGASSQYFIPCVLAHSEASQSKMPDTAVSHVPPLLVTFESGYCPKGLFGAVTVYLLQNKMKSKLEWGLEQDRIFRDQICLSVGPYDSFQLKVQPSFLSIDLCSSSGPSTRMISLAGVCSEVRQSISSAVDQVSVALHCSQKAEHSFGFFCQEQVDANQSPHPATVTFLEGKPCNLKCPITHKRFEFPDGCLLWFSEDCSTPDSKADTLATHHSGSHPSLDKQLSKSDVVCPSTALTGKAKVLDQQQSPNKDVTSEAIVLDSKPRIAELLMLKTRKGESVNIIKRLAPQWKEFGLSLDFDPTGSHLHLIEAECAHEPHRVVACCREMFKHWLEGNGVQPITWRTLIQLLDHCEELFLVEQIKDALKLN